jgi:acyl carrier protein
LCKEIEQMEASQRAEIEGELYFALAEGRGVSPDAARAAVGGDGEIDSLEGVELVAAAEARFGVRIADDELSPRLCRSLPRLIDLVAAKLHASVERRG